MEAKGKKYKTTGICLKELCVNIGITKREISLLVFWPVSIVRYSRNQETALRKLELFPSSGEEGRHLQSWVP
jgi:hypothetical protein